MVTELDMNFMASVTSRNLRLIFSRYVIKHEDRQNWETETAPMLVNMGSSNDAV
jgi:hypothetical protein